MPMGLLTRSQELINRFADACRVQSAFVDLNTRLFAGELPAFCADCPRAAAKGCDPLTTHLYGSYEAERWSGLYIYYCPLSLTFAATDIFEGKRPVYAAVCGPIVMGAPEDLLDDGRAAAVANLFDSLPVMPPAQVTALAYTQRSLCAFASGQEARGTAETVETRARLHNTLYEVTDELTQITDPDRYSLEIERRLQQMITHGDKSGAQELINRLLGHLYFNTNGNFEDIKRRAADLVVLFSRASIEGGADASQIMGISRDVGADAQNFETLTDLSLFLTRIFHRFVGYVFDFEQVKHADIINKTVSFIRQNYTGKISLDDAAGAVYLSRSYLSKIFKEEMDCTFTGYVSRVRIEKSRELLLDGSISIADIAVMVGFEDQSYFTKVFRRTVGVSPGEYRRRGGRV